MVTDGDLGTELLAISRDGLFYIFSLYLFSFFLPIFFLMTCPLGRSVEQTGKRSEVSTGQLTSESCIVSGRIRFQLRHIVLGPAAYKI